jgi:hypothetical protein
MHPRTGERIMRNLAPRSQGDAPHRPVTREEALLTKGEATTILA